MNYTANVSVGTYTLFVSLRDKVKRSGMTGEIYKALTERLKYISDLIAAGVEYAHELQELRTMGRMILNTR